MLANGKQVADIADFVNMDMSNVLNISSLAKVVRYTEGVKDKRAPELGGETAGEGFHFSTQKL